MENQNNEKKHGNSGDPQVSRPDLRFASRENSENNTNGPEPHQKTTKIHGATCRRGSRASISNRVSRNPAIPLHLQSAVTRAT